MESTSPKPSYDFSVQVPTRRPRAWERAPKSSFAPRHRGRKVWKRYELRSKEREGTRHNQSNSGKALENLGGDASPARPVKRLRNVPRKEGADEVVLGYTATLRSEGPRTPRRKFAKRKSFKPDLFSSAVNKAHESPRKSRGLSPVTIVRIEHEPDKDGKSFESPSRSAFEIIEGDSSRSAFESEVREDVPQAWNGPSEEDPNEALGSLSPEAAVEPDAESGWEDLKEYANFCLVDVATSAKANEKKTRLDPDGLEEVQQEKSTFEMDLEEGETFLAAATTTPPLEEDCPPQDAQVHDNLRPEPMTPPSMRIESQEASLTEMLLIHDQPSVKNVIIEQCEELQDFPQLPKNRCTTIASDVDSVSSSAAGNSTEILDKLEAEAQQAEGTDMIRKGQEVESEDVDPNTIFEENFAVCSRTYKTSELIASIENGSTQTSQPKEQSEKDELSHDTISLQDETDALLIDSIPSFQPDELYSNPRKQSPKPVVKLPNCPDSTNQDSQSEAGQAREEATDAAMELSTRTTRSGGRFSDDTNLLKDFLNRAQARKLAKGSKIPAQAQTQVSPRRSPRKALTEIDKNSPSPQNPKALTNPPGTPPRKERLDAFSSAEVDELTAEPTSCRRSNRTRLPAASKTPPGAPSFIPVRRADGTEPVILQKSMAQDLAVRTRTNTRRNKGQSKPPSVALQNLTVDTPESAANRVPARESCKSVGWDERLVYYQGGQETAGEEGDEEKRPKVRRLRGLGASNGTPAPKRVVDSGTPQGTLAPRRRGKLR